MSLWIGALALGLAFAAMAVGVYLSFRVLDFPDLTVDGSFPLGAAVSAVLLVQGMNAWATLPFAIAAGCLAGVATGLLTTRLRINGLMAGILVMISLYTVNLRLMGERSNIPLLGVPTLLHPFRAVVSDPNVAAVVVFAGTTALCLLAVNWFLNTELGLALRSTGDNERMSRALGVDTDQAKILGLAISNGLIALSGALVSQYQGFADVGSGLGMIVAGLASVIVGEAILRPRNVSTALAGAVVGSLIYRLAIALALRLGLAPTDLKLATAVIVIVALAMPQVREGMRFRLAGPVVAATQNSPGVASHND